MKFHVLPLLFSAALTVAFSSCNSNDKSSTDTKTDTAATTTTAPTTAAPASTVVTTPTNMLVVRHEVTDYNKWKMSYDAHDSDRLASGIHSYVIGRGAEDSNNVFVATKIDDVAKAKAFANNPSLKAAMQKGGVKGKAEVSFNTMVWQDTGTVNTTLRSRTTFMVKDFDTWLTSFQSHKQNRIDNGLADRAIGYDVDNHNKVTLVVVVNDTAKAKAYWKSDELKKLRAASGVIGEPVRYLYNMVQRY
jgi:hypothetical protein